MERTDAAGTALGTTRVDQEVKKILDRFTILENKLGAPVSFVVAISTHDQSHRLSSVMKVGSDHDFCDLLTALMNDWSQMRHQVESQLEDVDADR
jgi:hypothetical protein